MTTEQTIVEAELVCGSCGSPNVEFAAWVDALTGALHGDFGSWDELDTKWCRDCDANVELVDKDGDPARFAALVEKFRSSNREGA